MNITNNNFNNISNEVVRSCIICGEATAHLQISVCPECIKAVKFARELMNQKNKEEE